MWYFNDGSQDISFETIDEARDDFCEGNWAEDEIFEAMQEEVSYAELISAILRRDSISIYDIYEALERASEKVFHEYYYEVEDDENDESADEGVAADEGTNESEGQINVENK